jgi:purine-cytosine permease-like protein
MHRPNPPSIDPGVMAFVWALLLALFIYFGLKAVGASGATSIVLALLGFAGIWLFVRLRGEDRPGA